MDPLEDDAAPPSQPEPDDQLNEQSISLMLRAGQGDLEAFQELVELHQHAVVGTVAKMLGNLSDAEDIAQQVFVRIWKSASRYEPSAKFTTWMFTITRNLVFNEVRRRQRKPVVSLDERQDDFHIPTSVEPGMQPDESTLQHELETAVDAAIQQLPEKQRLAVVLRRYEHMPYEDIAEVLDLSLSAVKSLLFRARSQLKEILRTYLEGEES